jgi:hypothetical protein
VFRPCIGLTVTLSQSAGMSSHPLTIIEGKLPSVERGEDVLTTVKQKVRSG